MTQLSQQSLEKMTLPELYKAYGLNEARRIINDGKIESFKKLLNGKLITDTDVAELAELCEKQEKLFNVHFRLGQAIRKKEHGEDED